MEVKNQGMDQLLVNTAAQTPANTGAAKQKEQDGPDFDSMVNQRRSVTDKGETKTEKVHKPGKEYKTDDPAVEAQPCDTEPRLADGQLALAAMMLQMQGDVRVEQAPETADAVIETTAAVQMPELEQQAAIEVVPETETAGTEQTAQAEPQTVETETKTETRVARNEDTVEERPETDVRPETNTVEKSETRENDDWNMDETVRPERVEQARSQHTVEGTRRVKDETNVRIEDGKETEDAAQTVQAAPLLRNAETPDVKVVEVSKPVPLEAEDGAEQLGKELDGVLVNSADANRVEITLTPENLGKLTVEITRNENGNLSIVLHTTSERTASLLEKNVQNLQNALATGNRSNVEVQIRPAEETERQQFLNPDGQNDQNRGQQHQQRRARQDRQSAEDFLQQLRLGLVDNEDK
jgi:flagellar hook-length control protein FliK